MHKMALVTLALLGGAACDQGNLCDEYVQYMCDCHPEVDCAELRATYADADPAVQTQCQEDLDDQEAEDGSDGATCGTAGSGA